MIVKNAVDFCIPGAIQGGAWCFVNTCWSGETVVDSELIVNFTTVLPHASARVLLG